MTKLLCTGTVILAFAGCAVTSTVLGQSGSMRVIYYAPAWGPNEEGEEVVYFLKQVTFESGREQQNRIYLCSVKPDGSARKEIAELWAEKRDQWFESYATAATMEINAKTKRAAIGVEQGRMSGVFIVDLNGKNFHALWPKEWNEDRPTLAGYPTWSPDGNWIAFHEHRFEKGFYYYRIVKMRPDTTDYTPLTERNGGYAMPAWSPEGDLIACVQLRIFHLWLMKPDGSEKQDTKVWGRYPRWSPDGSFISFASTVFSVLEQKPVPPPTKVWNRTGLVFPKWGKSGLLSVGPQGVSVSSTDKEFICELLRNTLRRGSSGDWVKETFRW